MFLTRRNVDSLVEEAKRASGITGVEISGTIVPLEKLTRLDEFVREDVLELYEDEEFDEQWEAQAYVLMSFMDTYGKLGKALAAEYLNLNSLKKSKAEG